MRRVLVICILLFSVIVIAQTPKEIEIQTRITLIAEGLETRLEPWKTQIREVEWGADLAIERQPMILKRLSSEVTEVRLLKPFRFRYYQDGISHDFLLTKFQIRSSIEEAKRLMEYSAETIFTNQNTNHEKVREFVQEIRSDGLTSKMLEFAKEGAPLQLYKISSLHFQIPILPILNGEPATATSLGYWAKILMPHTFEKSVLEYAPRQIERLGPPVDIESEEVREYEKAYRVLADRIQTMRYRGWWQERGQEKPRRHSVDTIDFANLENVEPLKSHCRMAFGI